MAQSWIEFTREAQEAKVPSYPWFKTVTMKVVKTEDELKEVIDRCIESGRYGIDVEATGLDNRVIDGSTVDKIAGLGLAPDRNSGFYIPVRHRKKLPGGQYDLEAYHNISLSVFHQEFQRLMASEAVGVFHNAKYDHDMLQYEPRGSLGTWERIKTWDDTFLLAYLLDSRAKKRGLKYLSSAMLGLEMIELPELFAAVFGEKYDGPLDFSVLDPEWEPCIQYATADVIITLRLYDHLAPQVLEGEDHQRFIYALEKSCLTATRWMRRNRVCIDTDVVKQLIKVANRDYYNAMGAVYEEASKILGRDITPSYFRLLRGDYGPTTAAYHLRIDDIEKHVLDQIEAAQAESKRLYPDHRLTKEEAAEGKFPPVYDISSSAQLGQLLLELKVPGLRFTEKTGQVVTRQEVLDDMYENYKEQFPFLKKIELFRRSRKALSNYLLPMLGYIDERDSTGVINFNGQGTDTGRFSTPKDKDAPKGYIPINLQSLPATYDKHRPESMKRLRECIIPRPHPEGLPRFIVAIDYAGVELRIATLLSREPLWLKEYFRCGGCGHEFDRGNGQETPPSPPPFCPICGSDKIGDLHTLTAISLFGEEARHTPEWKQLRQISKTTNFALLYGGSGSAVRRAINCDENEGERIKRKFDRTYDGLKSWWNLQHRQAKQKGYVRTALGRKYPVPDIQLPRKDPITGRNNGIFISKARRNAVNGPVQGCSADITKLAMGLIFNEFLRRGWLEKARMLITMHDELVFEVDADILEEFVEVTSDIMARNNIILRQKWPIPLAVDVEIGKSWMVPWDLNAIRYGKVRAVGDKLFEKEDLPEGQEWETLSPWPDSLRPWFTDEDRPKTVETVEASPPRREPSPAEKDPSEENIKGETYEFRLAAPLTPPTAAKLAEVITLCRGGGTKELILISREGTVLRGWGDGQIIINPSRFYHLAWERGLC